MDGGPLGGVGGELGQLELGVQAGLVGLGQLDLVLLGQQRMPPNLIQVQTERVQLTGVWRSRRTLAALVILLTSPTGVPTPCGSGLSRQ